MKCPASSKKRTTCSRVTVGKSSRNVSNGIAGRDGVDQGLYRYACLIKNRRAAHDIRLFVNQRLVHTILHTYLSVTSLPQNLCLQRGQANGIERAFFGVALNLDVTTVQFDDFFGEAQAQDRAADQTHTGIGEGLEDLRQHIR